MGLSASFRIAPGVRVRASSRGLRTSIGPRGARVHVGAGRTTVSSGFGPFTASTPLGSARTSRARRASGLGSRPPSLAQLERQARAAQREEEIAGLRETERRLVSLHVEEFPPAERPSLPPLEPVDVAAITRHLEEQALAGLGRLDVAGRKRAKAEAQRDAESQAALEEHRRQAERRVQEQQLACAWELLRDNDTASVIQALDDAFEDNEWPATCVDAGISGLVPYATVVVLFGASSAVPDQAAAVTPTGRPTLRKRTKTSRNALYTAALGSTALATVKETFAVGPSVEEVRLLVVRRDPNAWIPADYLAAVYAATFERDRTLALPWRTLDPAEELLRVPGAQFRRRGAAGEVVSLDLEQEPELRQLVEELRSAVER